MHRRRACECDDVDPALQQHAVDVGLALALRSGGNRPVRDDLGHLGALQAEFVSDSLSPDVGPWEQDSKAAYVASLRDRADQRLGTVLRRGQIGLESVA